MKIKKALAILLVAVMLIVPFSVSIFAADNAIVSGPIKVAYKDSEYLNPQGLVISVDGKDITYTPDNAKFTFVPGLNEHLKTEVALGEGKFASNIDVYYDNELIGTITVEVAHIWGDITYMDNNFHGRYCQGCGVVEKTLAHNVPEYIPNDDGGLFINQTETGKCADCGHAITRDIPDSNKFNQTIMGGTGLTQLEMEIVGYLQSILVTLIQALAGIR